MTAICMMLSVSLTVLVFGFFVSLPLWLVMINIAACSGILGWLFGVASAGAAQ